MIRAFDFRMSPGEWLLLAIIAAMLISGCVARAAPMTAPKRQGVATSVRVEWFAPTNWNNGSPLINTWWPYMSYRLGICPPPWTGDPLLSSNWIYTTYVCTGANHIASLPATNGVTAFRVLSFLHGGAITNESDWSPVLVWTNEATWPGPVQTLRIP